VRKEVLEDVKSANSGSIATSGSVDLLKAWVESNKKL
jgi:hypothetical protein